MTTETKSKSQKNWTAQFTSAQEHKQNRKYKKAVQALEGALALARKHSLTEETFLSLKALADVQRLNGHLKQASRAEEEALSMSGQLFAVRHVDASAAESADANHREAEFAEETPSVAKKSKKSEKSEKSEKSKKSEKSAKEDNGKKTEKKTKEEKEKKAREDKDRKPEKKTKNSKVETEERKPESEHQEEEKTCRHYLEKAAASADFEKRAEYYRKAIKAARKELGKDWQKKYAGVHWLAQETRPIMQAMAGLARELRWIDEIDEAISIYEELLELNPNDNQGVRYDLAPCLFEAERYDKLEAHLRKYGGESAAIFLYTRALYLYKKNGNSKEARDALQRAFKRNAYVPLFLSEIVEMPDESPTFIGIGDENEAIAYVLEYSYQWEPEHERWLADTLEKEIYKAFADDQELVEEVLKELRLE